MFVSLLSADDARPARLHWRFFDSAQIAQEGVFLPSFLSPVPWGHLGLTAAFWGLVGSSLEEEESEGQGSWPPPLSPETPPAAQMTAQVTPLNTHQPHQALYSLPGPSPPGSVSDSTENGLGS